MSLFITREAVKQMLIQLWDLNEKTRRHLFVNPDEACAYLAESNTLITNSLKKYVNKKDEEMLRTNKGNRFAYPANKDWVSTAKAGDIKPIGSYDRIKQSFGSPQPPIDDGFND
jgi:hypothetical protein